MKGFFEEYGTFLVTVIIAIMVVAFLFDSMSNGVLREFITVNIENVGTSVPSE